MTANGATHLSAEDLVDYFDGDVSEEREQRIEAHVARCDACAERARQADALLRSAEQWSTQTQGEASLRSSVRAGIGEAAASPEIRAEWKQRLETWLGTTTGLAEGAVRLIVGALEERSRVLTDGLDSILRPGAFWRFDTTPATVPVRGLPAPDSAPPKLAVAEDSSGSRMWVKIEKTGSNRRGVVIRIDRSSFTQRSPMVVLIPCGNAPDRKTRITEMVPHGEGLRALFDDVDPGEHLLLIEPAPDSSED